MWLPHAGNGQRKCCTCALCWRRAGTLRGECSATFVVAVRVMSCWPWPSRMCDVPPDASQLCAPSAGAVAGMPSSFVCRRLTHATVTLWHTECAKSASAAPFMACHGVLAYRLPFLTYSAGKSVAWAGKRATAAAAIGAASAAAVVARALAYRPLCSAFTEQCRWWGWRTGRISHCCRRCFSSYTGEAGGGAGARAAAAAAVAAAAAAAAAARSAAESAPPVAKAEAAAAPGNNAGPGEHGSDDVAEVPEEETSAAAAAAAAAAVAVRGRQGGAPHAPEPDSEELKPLPATTPRCLSGRHSPLQEGEGGMDMPDTAGTHKSFRSEDRGFAAYLESPRWSEQPQVVRAGEMACAYAMVSIQKSDLQGSKLCGLPGEPQVVRAGEMVCTCEMASKDCRSRDHSFVAYLESPRWSGQEGLYLICAYVMASKDC
ncbi:hypothetical protein DUNSADRAFT_2165 [Dunaliella salina]|uniref:Uncharacterized protein n=1 Tax=Dunaliella salina TaxID=3046 RepID=A0ABQ7H8E6_DUNSA|nr:hypothetical protein DUNSADRAFT_2165 [Dunaliella salina]|eukprot:KAF5843128.1 hypothetical protein DUNSADRAFT_2165 [Dunaliella salina]